MRKLLPLIAGAVMVLTALPASADRPVPVTLILTNEYTNPCTGEDHTYTYMVNGADHYHEHNIVGVGFSTIETTDGYSGRAPDPLLLTASGIRINNANHILVNDETGSKMRRHDRSRIDVVTGDVLAHVVQWSCIHAPE